MKNNYLHANSVKSFFLALMVFTAALLPGKLNAQMVQQNESFESATPGATAIFPFTGLEATKVCHQRGSRISDSGRCYSCQSYYCRFSRRWHKCDDVQFFHRNK
jgi:hypothetical protein